MIDLILQIIYVLIAIAMVTLILLQRGAGAQAGAGFGAGASGTVFGARGSTNFMTKATKWLAIAFFGLSLFMAWKVVNINKPVADIADIGVMGNVPVVPESKTPVTPPSTTPEPSTLPTVPVSTIPTSVPAKTVAPAASAETPPEPKK
jgi:preprotein translocase subunit SecG